jgi:endoglucanase
MLSFFSAGAVAANDMPPCVDWCYRCRPWCCDEPDCLGCITGCNRPPFPPPDAPHSPSPPRPPAAPPDRAEYWTVGARIYTNAFQISGDRQFNPLRIKGISWFGFEGSSCYLGGGDSAAMENIASFLRSNEFNAVRIPLAADALLAGGCFCCKDGVYYDHNPQLMYLPYIDQLEILVKVLRDAGLLVMLDLHVLQAGVWPDAGLMGPQGAETLEQFWLTLAERFCEPERFWNVFAADLKNEPHGMSWGEPPDDHPAHLYPAQERWDAVASSVSAKLHSACPRWLVVVEGVGQCQEDVVVEGQPCRWPSATEQDVSVNAWWGENLQGVWKHPVRVQDGASFVQNKIVCARDCTSCRTHIERHKNSAVHTCRSQGSPHLPLLALLPRVWRPADSPHSYGPDVHGQSYFGDPSFPANMPSIWNLQYAALARHGVAPILVGECAGTSRTDC